MQKYQLASVDKQIDWIRLQVVRKGIMPITHRIFVRKDSEKDSQEAGAILVITLIALVVLIGIIGLAIDLGHAYVNKSQLQNIADACALAGASALDETASGIDEAQSRATDTVNLDNRFEFNKKPLTINGSWVSYSTALNGTYMTYLAAKASPAGIKFVKVTIPSTQSSEVFFAKVISGVPSVINLGATAVAGRASQTQVCSGLDPFAVPPCTASYPACSGNPLDLNHGYRLGNIYEVRFSPGSSGKTCSDYGLASTTGNFGLADPADCGPSKPCFVNTLVNGSSGNCIQIKVGAEPDIPGNMGTNVLNGMITRFGQDTDHTAYSNFADYTTYRNTTTNFRRIIRASLTDGYIPPGHSGNYNVTGFACFWMPRLPAASPPSSAICLMYVGSCDVSGTSGNTNEPSITKTVLFK
jgi:Flp pilus assembly protein TadG